MVHLAILQNSNIPDFGISTTTIVIIAAAVVVLLLITIIPSLLMIRKVFGGLKQTQTLLATGEAAQATILQLRDTGTTLNGNPQIEVLLEVRPANRSAYQAQTRCYVSRLRIPQVQPGAVVNVKIDPQNPANVALQLV